MIAPRLRLSPLAALLAAVVFSSACLSDMHRIPRHSLAEEAQKAPEQRGQRVRVIQGTFSEESPPEARPVTTRTTIAVGVYGTGGGRVRGVRGGSRGFRNLAKAKKDDARVWIIIAALAAVALAATEGARYDGWVQLHPMHPVHLFGPFGEYTQMPLAAIDPETAAWASSALVRPSEGPWQPLGRAPLNRVGFTYSLLLGVSEIPSAAEDAAGTGDTGQLGFQSHIQLGFFPAQAVGILLDFGMGYRDNDFGDTVFESRNALELQVLPLSAGIFHAGVFGDIGVALRLEDGAGGEDKRSFYAAGGALLQLEVTTRFALMGRAGLSFLFGEPSAEALLGVAIY